MITVRGDNYDERSCCLTNECSRGGWRCLIRNAPIAPRCCFIQFGSDGELRSVASGCAKRSSSPSEPILGGARPQQNLRSPRRRRSSRWPFRRAISFASAGKSGGACWHRGLGCRRTAVRTNHDWFDRVRARIVILTFLIFLLHSRDRSGGHCQTNGAAPFLSG